ncbi:MAG TPA: acyltransferase, partial [Micromonosporaceae bacterium]|nr:acyltransferase [Micromonosporaceae bacterium]
MFRPDVEGLRAVAVVLVVLYHAGVGAVGGGYVGVDVFLVISGYLITGLLLRDQGRGLAAFYARRALRLLPAATVVVAATVAAARAWLPPLRFGEVVRDALHTTFYGLNYRLAALGTDYSAADAAPSPLQHYWSLAVEEQFYLAWPPLLAAVCALAARRRRAVLAVLAVLAVTLGVVVAGSLALSVWQTAASAPWAYFGAHTRAWELGAGALLALAPVARLPRAV